MSDEFHLYVKLKALPGRSQELSSALQSLSKASLESGICLRFDVSQSVSDPAEFNLFESFESKKIYPSHVATDHAQHFLKVVVPSFVGEREVFYLQKTPFTN